MSFTWPAMPRSQLGPGVEPTVLSQWWWGGPSKRLTAVGNSIESGPWLIHRQPNQIRLQKRGDIPTKTRNTRGLARKCRKIWKIKCLVSRTRDSCFAHHCLVRNNAWSSFAEFFPATLPPQKLRGCCLLLRIHPSIYQMGRCLIRL